jgi:hypothetical protein
MPNQILQIEQSLRNLGSFGEEILSESAWKAVRRGRQLLHEFHIDWRLAQLQGGVCKVLEQHSLHVVFIRLRQWRQIRPLRPDRRFTVFHFLLEKKKSLDAFSERKLTFDATL